jgi:predicted metal-dependent hydrolase
MFLRWRLVRKRRRRRSSVTQHYLAHKEEARALVHAKLAEWNAYYGFTYKRVAIRNQRRSWGSCTSLKNLNFSYKILFLPTPLQDYLIVHELCHLAELNHGKKFWELVAQQIPDYKERMSELKHLEKSRLIA